MEDFTLPFIWVINGFLAVLYTLLDNILLIFLLAALLGLFFGLPRWLNDIYLNRLRPFVLAASLLVMVAAVLAPSPVAFFLTVMAAATLGAMIFKLEKSNPANVVWGFVNASVIYSFVGIGFNFLQAYFGSSTTNISYLAQGQNYLGIVMGIMLYLFPTAYLGWLVKNLFLHKPVQDPNRMIGDIRVGRGGR